MARLWRRVLNGCKYLVTRRDGSIPTFKHFVLGSRDEAAPAALRAYADKAAELLFDPAYVQDIRAEADDWEAGLATSGKGDPDAPRHRTDDPVTVRKMTGEPDPTLGDGDLSNRGLNPFAIRLVVESFKKGPLASGVCHVAFYVDDIRFEIGVPAPSEPKASVASND